LIYCPFAASIKIKSYPGESVRRISVASPSRSVILCPVSYAAKFFFATGIRFSYFSIVVILQSAPLYLAIRSAENPTAQPTSRIFTGLCSVIRNRRRLCVSLRIIGTSSFSACCSSSSSHGSLPESMELIKVVSLSGLIMAVMLPWQQNLHLPLSLLLRHRLPASLRRLKKQMHLIPMHLMHRSPVLHFHFLPLRYFLFHLT